MTSLNIPASSSTVRVAIIDTTTYFDMQPPTAIFMGPTIKGFERWNAIALGFLVTHTDGSGKEQKMVFDLGVPKNWEDGLPPHSVEVGKMLGLSAKKYVSEILEENGVPLDSIDSIIWSHPHLDHVGRPSLFHPDTSLVVGPGVKRSYFPGYPTIQNAPVFESELQGREVVEMDFETNCNLEIGGFKAIDFFGDGSFYLLSAPGHCLGHMIALARTTSSTSGSYDSFILMSADTFHHGAEFRPSQGVPLPKELTLPNIALPPLCPCEFFHVIHPATHIGEIPEQYRKVYQSPNDNVSTTPFQTICETPTGESQALDVTIARKTLSMVQEFDADPNILVVAAHDATVAEVAELFPKEANEWKANDWKEKARWRYLEHLVPAVEQARRGKQAAPIS